MINRLSMLVFMFCLAVQPTWADEPTVSFRGAIAPILLESCLACHGAKKTEGGYRVDSYEQLMKAGDSGAVPIAEKPEETSELLRRITCSDDSERMPVDSEPLGDDQIAIFKQWIAAGAKFDGDDPSQALALVIPPTQYADPPANYPHAVPLTAIIFSPDGKQLIAGGYHELTVWDIENGSLLRRINNLGQRIFGLSFSPDAEILAVACGEPGVSGEVRLVNFGTGEIQGVIARSDDVVLDIAFRPGTSELAIASADSTIRIINIKTLEEVRTIASHADWVTAVAWSDDGKLLASASRDKSAKVYDGESGELLSSYLGHGAAVRGVSITSDNKQAVSIGADNQLHRWQITEKNKVAEVALGGEGNMLLRQENNLFVPCADKRLLRIDLASNTVAQEYKGHGDWVLSIAEQPGPMSDPSNHFLVSGSFDGELRLWKASDGTLVRSWIAKP